jgi:hypothetical protein
MSNHDGTLAITSRRLPGAALVDRWLGALLVGPRHLAALDTDTLLRRGLGEARARELLEGNGAHRKEHGQAIESFLQSAEAHARILGERYGDALQSHAIHGVVSETRAIDLDQRELLHPAPQHVPQHVAEISIHDRKTPNVTLEG